MKKITALLFLLCILSTKAIAQYSASDIPSELLKNAQAVIRLHDESFTMQNTTTALKKITVATTVLNEKGRHNADFEAYYDKFSRIKKFEGRIFDKQGKQIRTIKRADLSESGMSSSALFSDNKTMFYECYVNQYPYTVEYSYEQEFFNGFISYPFFAPVNEYNVSVEKAYYTLTLPAQQTFHFKECNMPSTYHRQQNGNSATYRWEASNIPAIVQEPFSPSTSEFTPLVMIAPDDFCMEGVCGKFTTWRDYGLWANKLLNGRDILPDELRATLQNIVSTASTDVEKVQKIFEYLQSNTRYVSIQLGIGGFQPDFAANVCKTKFGDCKGLSNYMKAMLKEVGINAVYCEVGLGRKEHYLYPDFSSVTQTNHVILMVPLKSDTLWLECTNQSLPFAYLHTGIEDRDVLAIKEGGGEIIHTPAFSAMQNSRFNILQLNLSNDGSATGNVASAYMANRYEDAVNLTSTTPAKAVEVITRQLTLPGLSIKDLKQNEQKGRTPILTHLYAIEAKDFASAVGKRMFIPFCIFKRDTNLEIFSSATRERDIVIPMSFTDKDSMAITIPTGYVVETLAKPKKIASPFGTFESNTKLEDGKLISEYTYTVNKGRYPASEYAALKAFFAEVGRALRGQSVIQQKE